MFSVLAHATDLFQAGAKSIAQTLRAHKRPRKQQLAESASVLRSRMETTSAKISKAPLAALAFSQRLTCPLKTKPSFLS
jgi:hypothetical protein